MYDRQSAVNPMAIAAADVRALGPEEVLVACTPPVGRSIEAPGVGRCPLRGHSSGDESM
jgi:hypothetical protein